MVPFQVWLEAALRSFKQVAALMRQEWAWPITESVHFVGLTLLFGSIVAWDLRLLGVAKQVPRLRHSTAWFRSPSWDSRSTRRAERSF